MTRPDRERPEWMNMMDAIAYFGLFAIMITIAAYNLASVVGHAVEKACR